MYANDGETKIESAKIATTKTRSRMTANFLFKHFN